MSLDSIKEKQNQESIIVDNNEPTKKNNRKGYLILLGVLALLVIFCVVISQFITFFVIQPIGAIPNGITLVIPRGEGTKFFDSADALCMRNFGGVSLLCRLMAISAVTENSKIIVRLPYIDFFYMISTGGTRFEK